MSNTMSFNTLLSYFTLFKKMELWLKNSNCLSFPQITLWSLTLRASQSTVSNCNQLKGTLGQVFQGV